MPREPARAWLTLLLLSGCATPHNAAPSKQVIAAPAHPRSAGAEQRASMISGVRREKSCNGPAYASARRYAADWLDQVVSVPTDRTRIAQVMENGRFRIQLAQMAALHKCYEAARDTYAEVNEIFTGAPYSSLRRRADAALSKIPRSAPPSAPNHTKHSLEPERREGRVGGA